MRKPIVWIGLLLLVIAFFLFPPQKTATTTSIPSNPYVPRLIDSVEQFFQRAIQDSLITGAAVAIVSPDTILYLGGFGYRNAITRDTVDIHSLFRIGSLSKGFAGVLAAKLHEEGLIALDDPVKRYFPEFILRDSLASELVTLTHLLTHSPGLPYHTYTDLIEANQSLLEIARQFHQVPLIGNPGEIYSYQNAAFALVGPVLEAASGRSTSELLEAYLFHPLQMERASASWESIVKDSNVALPHKGVGPGAQPQPLEPEFYNAVLAGGINASISDMARWMHFLLNGHPSVLSRQTLKKTVFHPRINTRVRNRYFQRWHAHTESWYGLGWRIHTYPDTAEGKTDTLYHHGGAVNGYRSEIALYPEHQVGICVLFTSQNGLAARVIPETFRRIEGPLQALRSWDPLP